MNKIRLKLCNNDKELDLLLDEFIGLVSKEVLDLALKAGVIQED